MSNPLPADYQEITLDNGLRIVAHHAPQVRSAALGFFVKTGARDEDPSVMGVSHFLEHMLFKGTKKRTADQINIAIGNAGAQNNAYTSEENTVYYGDVISEQFSAFQEILTDQMEATIPESEFVTEKKVILEEIAMYEDDPHKCFYYDVIADYFKGLPLAHRVLGTKDTISRLSRDQMHHYFAERYRSNNIVLAASGNFDVARFFADAKALCGSWQPGPTPRQQHAFNPVAKEVVFTRKDLGQASILMLNLGPSRTDDMRYEADTLATILGDAVGSRAYWDIVHPGLAESASISNDESDGYGLFMTYASCPHDKIEVVTKKLRHILTTALDFSDADLQRAKTKLSSRIAMNAESVSARLFDMGVSLLNTGTIDSVATEIAKVNAVSRESIAKFLAAFPQQAPATYCMTVA